MATNWLLIDGTWYYLNQDGSMATGLIEVNGVQYYLGQDGAMAADTNITIGDVTYHADSSGGLSIVLQEDSGQEDGSSDAPQDRKITGPGDLLQ